MAKKFFYVCAGVLLLALSWHLGAQSAGAQTAGPITNAVFSTTLPQGILYVSDRVPWFATAAFPCSGSPQAGPVPGSSPIVHLDFGRSYYLLAVLENGDVFYTASAGGSWTLGGNLLCGPVPTDIESWGALKQRYR